MTICALSPFQFTNTTFETAKNNFTAGKVMKASLLILALLGTVTADIIALPFIGAYRIITRLQNPSTIPRPSFSSREPMPRTPPSPIFLKPETKPARLSIAPAPERNPILCDHLLTPMKVFTSDSIIFLKDSIEKGLSFCSNAKRKEYIDLIENDNEPEGGGVSSINIYQWAAACSIAYYFTFKLQNSECAIPSFLNPIQTSLTSIFNDFKKLSFTEQATVLLRTYTRSFVEAPSPIDPKDMNREENLQLIDPLSPRLETLAHTIWTTASVLQQDQTYITTYFTTKPQLSY